MKSSLVPPVSIVDTQVRNGMLIMVLAMLMMPALDAVAKTLAATIPTGQVAWARFFFQTLLLLPVMLIRRNAWRSAHMGMHALRGLLIATATLFFFSALKYMPIADTISVFFVSPLILSVLSVLFLNETIGWRRISAITVGFIGALIVIRPSYEIFGLIAILPVCSAIAFAVYLVLTRRLAQGEDPVAMQFYVGVFGCLVMSVALGFGTTTDTAVLDPVWPDMREWVLMVVLGIIATVGHLLVVHAFRRAPASVLAPFQYLEIISATLLGLIFFGDFPDTTTWIGISIIISSGAYVFYRERRVR